VRGAIPYAVVGPGKESAIKAIGAEASITRGKGRLRDVAPAATGGEAIDVVVDSVAGTMLPDLLEVLSPHGRYVTCGAIGGAVVEIDMRRIYLKHLQIHGSSQGTRSDFAAVRDYALSGAIKPLLAATYPLAEIARAQAHFKRKDFVGKLVVVVD